MKTRKTFLAGIVLLFVTSCGILRMAEYHVYDEFKDNHRYTITFLTHVDEIINDIGYADIRFVRDINPTGETTKAYFNINKPSLSSHIEPRGFLKAGNRKFDVEIRDLRTTEQVGMNSTITNSVPTDTSKVKSIQKITTVSDSRLTDQFVILLTPEMIKSIRESNELTFRFYFEPSIATYKIKSSGVNRLIKMLNENPLTKE